MHFSLNTFNSEQLSTELMRRTAEESRRLRKQTPLMTQTTSQQLINVMSTSSSHHHTNSLPRHHHDSMNSMNASASEEYTFAVYTFGDEKIPYRTKIPGKRLTLKHFKEYSPKKGNFRYSTSNHHQCNVQCNANTFSWFVHFRYFFTTVCDDPDSPVIQEEVINDMDTLPLYEGKIMGTLKAE